MVDVRNVTMLEQMARNALTNITVPPVPGQAYRNTALDTVEMANGDRYDSVFDSAKYNQAMWMITGLLRQTEQFGILPYSALTNYPAEALCMGLNGIIYKAIQASGPAVAAGPQPTSNPLFWKDYVMSYYTEYIEKDYWVLKLLTVPTNFYVDGVTGNDDIAVNDGLTPATAWKTIQGGTNNIANNYFMLASAVLNVIGGSYNEDITLPKFFSSQGIIVVSGAGRNSTNIDGSIYAQPNCGTWQIQKLTISYAGRSSPGTSDIWYYNLRSMPGSTIIFNDMSCGGGTGTTTESRHGLEAIGGLIQLNPGVMLSGVGASMESILRSERGGTIQILGDLQTDGMVSVANFYALNAGSIIFDPGLLGRTPVISGSVAGYRAYASFNGIINTNGGGGSPAIPGTMTAAPVTGGQIA